MDKVKKALIIIAIYAALGFILMIFIFGYRQDLGKQEAIEKQEKAIATITSLRSNIQEGKKETWYDVYYEYTAENGTHYWGIIPLMTYDREYALSLIGNEVEIYIDGKGNCLRVSEVEDFDVDYSKNWCIIIGAIIAAYTIVWVALIIRENIVPVPKTKKPRKE